MNDISSRLISLFFIQSIDGPLSIDICHKTEPLCFAALCKLIGPGRIKDDPEAVNDRITVGFNNAEDFVQYCVELFVFLASGIGCDRILNGYGIGKLIVCQQFAVAVVYVASGSGNLLSLADLKFIVCKVIFSSDDLQIEKPSDQDRRSDAENDDERDEPGTHDISGALF